MAPFQVEIQYYKRNISTKYSKSIVSFNPYGEWEEYQNIEEDFLRYLRNVPLVEAHYDVWSFPLSNFLINIGSLVDSFFKNIAYEDSMRLAPGIDKITGEDGRSNIVRYQAVFEPYYLLSKSTIFELRNYSGLIPFANWGTDNGNATAPEWWEAYTDLKHDRFQNKEQATLKNTLDALGALFLLNVKAIETIRVLLDHRIINPGPFPIDSAKRVMSHQEPLDVIPGANIHAKTGLFGYIYENKNDFNNDEKAKKILSPSYRGFG